jgi:flagellar biosynthetic protein FliR
MVKDDLITIGPVFLAALARVGGVVAFAPAIGSTLISWRLRAAITLVLTVGIWPALPHPAVATRFSWNWTLVLAPEMVMGAAIGMGAGLILTGAGWAGEMISHQMGLGLGELFDPQAADQASPVGRLYVLLATVVFLGVNGHHALIRGLSASFTAAPPVAAAPVNLLPLLAGTLQSISVLAIQLAAPVVVTMLIVHLVIGLLTRALPQIGSMSASLALGSIVGIVILLLAAALTSNVIGGAVGDLGQALEPIWARGNG